MTDTVTYTVQVDSRDRDASQTANNYVMYLTEPVKLISDVIIRDIQVPNSTYNVVDGNNTFDIIGTAGNAITTINVEIEPGSYSGLDLASHLYNITAYKSIAGTPNLDANWNVVYRTGSKKFIFTQGSEFQLEFPSGSDLMDTLGFNPLPLIKPSIGGSSYYVNDITLQDEVLPSDRIADLVKDKYFYLEIAELTDPLVQTAKHSGTNGLTGSNLSRIFGKVPVYAGPGNDVFFDRNNTYKLVRSYQSPLTSLARLSIKWTDYQGNLINFNGLSENSFTLELVCENRTKTW